MKTVKIIIKDDKRHNLYSDLITVLKAKGVPSHAIKTPLDIYDAVRTLVMASQDNAIISWIGYHWSHLRLARSTLVPALIFIVLMPSAVIHWQFGWNSAIWASMICFIFFITQLVHYYYRERFMIYAMVSYFLLKAIP